MRQPTQEALLWWWRHNESIWSMFFRELLIKSEEVAEASPHCECLVAKHGQCGLKHTLMEFMYPAGSCLLQYSTKRVSQPLFSL